MEKMENLSEPPPSISIQGYIPSTNVFSPDDTKILTHQGLYDVRQKKLLWEKDLRLAALSDDGNHFVNLQLNGADWAFASPRTIEYGDASNGNILFQKDAREEFWRTNVAINTTGRKTIIVAKIRNNKIRAWKLTPTGIKPMGKTKVTNYDEPIARVDIRPDGKDVVLVERFFVKVWDLKKNKWRFVRYFDFNTNKAPDIYKTEDKKYLLNDVSMYLPVVLCASYNKTGSQIALGSGIYYKNMSAAYHSYLWRQRNVEKVKSAKVRIIDSETGDDVKVFALPRDYDTVNSVSFSPNDSQIACSACNYTGDSYNYRGQFELMQTIMVFDIETGACLLHCPFDFRNLVDKGGWRRKTLPMALNVAHAHNENQIVFGNRLLDISNANRIQSTVREFPVISTVLGRKDLEVNVSRSANMVQLGVIGFVNGEQHPLTIRVSLYRIVGNETNIDFDVVPTFLIKFVDESILNELNNSEITDLYEACIRLFNSYNDTPTASTTGVKRKRELKLKLKF
jgi:hypothetical protein